MKNELIDYYGILELDFRASPELVNAAYEILSNKYGGDEKVLSQLTEAFQVLSDVERRRSYDEAQSENVEQLFSEYRNITKVGESRYGDVYVAIHLLSGEKVCIKHCRLVSPQYEEQVIKEAKATWNLSHHRAIFPRDIKKLSDGTIALILRYCPGLTLETVVERLGIIDEERVLRISERVSNVLMYMHDQGVAHGGLEPSSIVIDPQTSDVNVVSFGLAMVKPQPGSVSTDYIPHFSSPEQKRGESLTPESDYYSLGMLMIFMLGGGQEAVKNLQLPADIPAPIRDFIKKLVQRNPDNRLQYAYSNIFQEIKDLRTACFNREHSFEELLPELKNIIEREE